MSINKVFYILLIVASTVTLGSCGSSKEVVYFQDLRPGETEIKLPEVKAITVRPEDKISIIVNSRDPQLTDLFNLQAIGSVFKDKWRDGFKQSRSIRLYRRCQR